MNKSSLIVIAVLSTLSTSVLSIEKTESPAETVEIRSTLNDQQTVAVTIYNNNLALVKDQRKVKLHSGLNNFALRDVSAQIRPETALLRSLSNAGSFIALEQNFDFDLLTPQKLLEKYVGKNVSIIKTNPATGIETTEQATVLSANNGIVMKIGNRIETGIPGRIVYDDVPANLRDRPTLVTKLGLGLDVLADVPLADALGDVTRRRQQLGQRDLAVEPARLAVHRRPEQAVAQGQPAGHERRPRRRARRLGVARRELQATACQPVDVRGGSADGDAAAVAAEITPAHVVEQDHQDVGAATGRVVSG